jgi:hypothetical protein
LRRNGLPSAPERKRTTPWSVFIRTHLALLAGTDFFTAEVLTPRGLVTVIHHWDGAFAVPSGWITHGLRGLPDARKGRRGNIAIADFGLSAFALFFRQSASFLAFQRAVEKAHGRSNCQTLFGIGKIPSDNYIRDMLDAADPVLLQPCFERMEQLLTAPSRVRNLTERSRMILWLEVDCTCARPTMRLANAQVSPNIACAVDR